jgi:hypothetical protein
LAVALVFLSLVKRYLTGQVFVPGSGEVGVIYEIAIDSCQGNG